MENACARASLHLHVAAVGHDLALGRIESFLSVPHHQQSVTLTWNHNEELVWSTGSIIITLVGHFDLKRKIGYILVFYRL